jgi:hypothetical protein
MDAEEVRLDAREAIGHGDQFLRSAGSC